jgi:hypothetical protein
MPARVACRIAPHRAARYDLRPARRPAPPSEASDSSESAEEAEEGPETEEQQAEQVREGLRDLGFQLKDLNADQPGQPPAWVFWHPQLFLAEQVADIEAELAETVAHFQNRLSSRSASTSASPSAASATTS